MVWKKIVERWTKVESYGKELPILVAVVTALATLMLSATSPWFKEVLSQLFGLMIRYWIELLLVLWLIVLTMAVSRIRTAMLYAQTREMLAARSKETRSPKELLNNLTLLDGIVLAYCAEKANMTSVSDVLDEVRLASKGTGQRVSSGELLNRLYLLEKNELLHLSMNKQTVFMSEEGRAFYFENKAAILTFVNTAIDKMLAERTAHG